MSTISDGADGIAAEHEAGVVVVQLADGVSAAGLNESLEGIGCLPGGFRVSEDDVALGYAELPLADGVSVPGAMVQLQSLPTVKSSQPNFVYRLHDEAADLEAGSVDWDALTAQTAVMVDDQYVLKQWALESVKAFDAWNTVKSNGRATVAVIDTGCDLSHPDLVDNIVSSYDAVAKRVYLSDSSGHGTHVCGIIAATANNGVGVAGVSYNAQLFPINVFRNDYATTASLVGAYNRIIENASYYNIRVANMSLGVEVGDEGEFSSQDKDAALYNAVLEAREAGVLTVCSAGNDADTLGGPYLSFPSDYLADIAMSVIALEPGESGDGGDGGDDLAGNPVKTGYSNYNMPGQTAKDIAAPGGTADILDAQGNRIPSLVEKMIYSTYYSKAGDRYLYMSGTSQAAPYVTGVAALLFSANPSLTPAQAKDILHGSATDLGAEGWDEEYGFGEVNAKDAVSEQRLGLFLDGNSSVLKGGSLTLSPSAAGSWTWASGNPGVASVNSGGVVAGLAGGSTVITATRSSDGAQVSREIVVYDVTIGGHNQVRADDVLQLEFNEDPVTGMWLIDTSDESVAKVSELGDGYISVLGVSEGTARITATLASNRSLVVSFDVTVLPPRFDFSQAMVSMMGWTYDGQVHMPEVTVMVDGTVLDSGEYSVTYLPRANAGYCFALVTPTDLEKYKGQHVVSCSILRRDVTLTSASATKVYDGTPLTAPSVTVGGDGFVEGEVSSVVATGTITNVGSVGNTIVISPTAAFSQGNYTLSATTGQLTVTPRSIADAAIAPIDSLPYTGEAVEPELSIEVDGMVLDPLTDFDVSYANNVDAGTATVTVTGKGNYEGTTEMPFAITPLSIEDADITDLDDAVYTGSPIEQMPTVSLDGTTLDADTDFDVSYADNLDAGTATVTVTGKGNYEGTVASTFEIAPASMATVRIAGLKDATFTGEPIVRVPVVRLDSYVLAAGKDYDVSYTYNTNVGTAVVTMKGKGNCTGSVISTFAIAPASIANARIVGLEDAVYNGKSIEQTPIVMLGSTVLAAGTDYDISYADNKNAGTAAVMVEGKGNYAGMVKATFKIKKASNTIKVVNSQKAVYYSKVKKKARVVKPLAVKAAKGTVSYAKVAKGSSSKLTVDKKTGKVTVKKGTKRGTYRVKVKVSAAGNENYKAYSKTFTCKVRVR